MKEKIYTIPVMDAFTVDCECPLCVLERNLEEDRIGYVLGPSLMEPDSRIETNEKGFCRRHFEQLYNKQENRLGLGLIIDTHMVESIGKLKQLYGSMEKSAQKQPGSSFIKNLFQRLSAKSSDRENIADMLLAWLSSQEKKCAVCDSIAFNMDRYIDVVLYLYFREKDFRDLFSSKKGFCMVHFKLLVAGAKKYLDLSNQEIFLSHLMRMQLENLDRTQEDVNWFTKKFDYRNNDAPWKNSKDAIPRSIQKLVGFLNLK